MTDIEFTALIPAYNEELYIRRAIESVLSQSIRPEQILVVDDGSRDNTASIIREYSGEGVEYIYQRNSGLAAARNTGIGAARGKVIGFLDSDDEWKPHFVSDIKEIFAKYPQLVWATGPYVRLLESGEVEFVRRVSQEYCKNGLIEDYFDVESRFHFSIPCAMFVKRKVFDRVGTFDTVISQYGEDLDMWFRIAMRYPQIGYTESVGAVYWQKTGSIMDTDTRDVERDLGRIQRTESHAMSAGAEILSKVEPVVLDWVWRQVKEAAVQGNSKGLEHISKYYGRRFPLKRRLILDLFRLVPSRRLWATVRKLNTKKKAKN
jgi:glycosyltransferase involved in cell wall biosynthesis